MPIKLFFLPGRALKYWSQRLDLNLIRKSPLFDRSWYLANYPDVAAAGIDPALHYLLYGWLEGRDPGPDFSTRGYLESHEAVKKAGTNPLLHFIRKPHREAPEYLPAAAVSHESKIGEIGALPATVHFDDDAPRVFCISMQRTGTTSVGKFFRDFGFRWAGWPADDKNNWSGSWYEGDWEAIFSSADFRSANAFEDSPWFLPDFYKVLFYRFPNSRFILFHRDPDAWFRSMLNHSKGELIMGNMPGAVRIHTKIYRRELEYYDLVQSGAIDEENRLDSEKKMRIAGRAAHYLEAYRLHLIEVQDFFRRHSLQALFVGRLEDPEKWRKLGLFLGLDVPADYDSRENVSIPNRI